MKKKIAIILVCVIFLVLISIPLSFSLDNFNGNKISSNTSTLYTKYQGNL